MQEIARALKDACQKLFNTEINPELSRPEEQFGDFATNAALQLGQKLGKNPREIAMALAGQLHGVAGVADVQIAGPGFINLKLTDEALAKTAFAATDLPKPLAGQQILVEFGDPNPFKEMHIGHLYSYIVGDAIASLLKTNGAEVKRLSYHGDVGLHVAKAIYGMKKFKNLGEDSKSVESVKEGEKFNFLEVAYAYGAKAYEEDDTAKTEIDTVNEHVYKRDVPEINELYDQGVKESFAAFDKILDLLSISTDKRYLETQSAQAGLELVRQNTGKVFKKSQGAIIYDGVKAGLHIRVFITSKGLPTYETKDLGLAELKDKDFPDAARSIIITASEQADYFKVMLAALAEIKPELAAKTTHLSHGFLSLSTGKMSSRTGDVYSAEDLLRSVEGEAKKQYPSADTQPIYLAATKYAFLKHRMGSDIVVDVSEAVNLEGNSGPYLQYAFARASSVLAKAGSNQDGKLSDLTDDERSLARKISEYPEVVTKATDELMPHHICTYLYELAQAFNHFYEKNRVIGDSRQAPRLALVKAYAGVLKHGLGLLNITAPEKL